MTTEVRSGLDGAFYRDDPRPYVLTAWGSNKDLCFSSQVGTLASITIVVSGSETPLSVSVVGNAVTVNSETNVGGDPVSTAQEVLDAVNVHATAKTKFHVRLPNYSDGSGVVQAKTQTYAADGTAFSQISLVDSGDHQIYQAALGYRYWDTRQSLSIQKRIHNAGDWITVYPLVYYISGRVYFATPLNSDDVVRATGTRRAEGNFQKLFNMYAGQLTFNQVSQIATNDDSDGFEESVRGLSNFQFVADTYYYDDPAQEQLDLQDMPTHIVIKAYEYKTGNIAFIGYGYISADNLIFFSMRNSQSKKVTWKGDGELYPELGV